MGAIYNSIPEELAGKLQREFGLKVFVETGLGQRTSALWAEKHFNKCFSIENDSTLVEKFKYEHSQSRVIVFCGGSGIGIVEIVPALVLPTLFWLDAHTDDYTPVLIEIAAINASRLNHIILVDDLRLFGQLPKWPTRAQLTEAALDNGRRAIFDVDDVLIATPVESANKIEYLKEKTC